MPATGVKSKWENGDLVFYDASNTEIMRFDASEAAINITKILLGNTQVTATAAELNKLDGVGDTVANGTQVALISDPTGGTTVDVEARAAINSIIDALQAFGIVATS